MISIMNVCSDGTIQAVLYADMWPMRLLQPHSARFAGRLRCVYRVLLQMLNQSLDEAYETVRRASFWDCSIESIEGHLAC